MACCQIDPVSGGLVANTELIADAIAAAVPAGADVIVLPELATWGYAARCRVRCR
ncbi:MAG TPA: nitrilase-related carbon-nitrogen hydrolase [Mycobacterium sp.]